MNKSFKSAHSAFSLIELSIVILIIGILIAGVISGSKLLGEANLKTARALTKASPVNSIPGIQMWIETTAQNSVTSYTNGYDPQDGDFVTSWNDINPQSTNNKINPSQSDTTYMPTYKEKGIGGLPSILMTGDSSATSSIAPVLSASGARASMNNTVFVVFNLYKIGSFSNDIFAISGGCGTAMLLEINLSNIRSLYRSTVGGSGGESFSGPGIANTFKTYKNYIMSSVRNYAQSNTKLWINNTLYINQAISLDDFNNIDNSVVIGNLLPATCGSTYRSLNGEISEVIYFDSALSQEEIDAVESYLSQKYKIKIT